MERRAYENIFAFHETVLNQNHATRYNNYCYGYNSFLNMTYVKKVEYTSKISFWHLLMNLKNNYQKNYWKGQIKNVGISILTMLFKKNKERKTPAEINILDLCTKNVDDMITSSWNKENSVRNSPRQSANAEAYLHFIVLIKMPRQLNS